MRSATVGGATGTYVYDGDGKRSTKTVGSTATNYVYDVSGGLPVVLDDGVRKYVWGANGLAYTVDKNTGAVQVYHTDGLGSVRAITDSAANVTQTYQTDEFGIPILTQGTSAQPFGFTGEQRDPEDGLVYLRARMYDPRIGRFVERDPLPKSGPGAGGWNRYSYSGNNSVTHVDPSGLCASKTLTMGPLQSFGIDEPGSWGEMGPPGVGGDCGISLLQLSNARNGTAHVAISATSTHGNINFVDYQVVWFNFSTKIGGVVSDILAAAPSRPFWATNFDVRTQPGIVVAVLFGGVILDTGEACSFLTPISYTGVTGIPRFPS